jgi:hypothetical protein
MPEENEQIQKLIAAREKETQQRRRFAMLFLLVSAIACASLPMASAAVAQNPPPAARTELLEHFRRATVSLGRLDDHQQYTLSGQLFWPQSMNITAAS